MRDSILKGHGIRKGEKPSSSHRAMVSPSRTPLVAVAVCLHVGGVIEDRSDMVF